MRRKAVIDRLYLFFWFFPIVLLPFTWVNAVVQGGDIRPDPRKRISGF